RLRLLVLDADDDSTANALDDPARNRLDRRNSVCGRFFRNVVDELEFRSNAGTTLAFRHSTTDRCCRADFVVFTATLRRASAYSFYASRIWHQRLLRAVLGASLGLPFPISCCSGSGFHQLHGQYRGTCWTKNYR